MNDKQARAKLLRFLKYWHDEGYTEVNIIQITHFTGLPTEQGERIMDELKAKGVLEEIKQGDGGK